MTDKQEPVALCMACEGKPAPENNPCAVCGTSTPYLLQAEPVAWRHTLHMEFGQTHTRLSEDSLNPFGEPGADYSAEYTVTSEPLYTRANRPADDRLVEALLEEAGIVLVSRGDIARFNLALAARNLEVRERDGEMG